MKAFAILSGGGVKGAALAGCLAAGEGQDIEFIGYGGTSAGSIVALLASVGYSGEAIRDLITNDVPPKALLDDEGGDLSLAREYLQRCTEILKSSSRTPTKLWRYWRVFKDANWLIQRLWNKGGLYTGAKFRSILLDIVTRAPSKVKHLRGQADITFSNLEDAGCTPLRIVASDISGQRAAVYSANDTSYTNAV